MENLVHIDWHALFVPKMSPAEIVLALRDTHVVMLSESNDDEDFFGALRAGACGYLLKDTDPDRLPHALAGVISGEAALPRALVTRLVAEFRKRERSDPRRHGLLAKLTQREWGILDLLCAGMTTGQIASELFVTPVTVRTHVSAILRKLHVSNREDAIRLAAPKIR